MHNFEIKYNTWLNSIFITSGFLNFLTEPDRRGLIMKKRTFAGGIHPPGHKELTADLKIIQAETPKTVFIPLAQHIGAPCYPLVEVGDLVKVGQKLGDASSFVSAPVHSSVSGRVTAVTEILGFGKCIVLENDGEYTPDPAIVHNPHSEDLTPDQLRQVVRDAGIVGMGGAAFPAHVKFSPPQDKPIEFLVLNGSECEPYLTADHRVMLEQPERIIAGMKYIMKMLGCSKSFIGIEDNKMDAVKALQDIPGLSEKIEIVPLLEKYPQGSEKHLIHTCVGREVPAGGLPLDVGVVVSNVGTAVAVADAVEEGIPLIERVVTVSGSGIVRPANYRVKIGTLVSSLVEQSGGYTGKVGKIISGGPMMGRTLYSGEVPITKGTSGVLFVSEKEVVRELPHACVRCARCVDACPMFLMPTILYKNTDKQNWEAVEENHVLDCIECGSCSYVCPAKIPLVQYIRQGKEIVSSRRREAAAAKA